MPSFQIRAAHFSLALGTPVLILLFSQLDMTHLSGGWMMLANSGVHRLFEGQGQK